MIGGGNAGISLAAFLLRQRQGLRVAIVEPRTQHTYRPLLSYVGGGLSGLARTERAPSHVMPEGCEWYRDAVVSVTPQRTARGHGVTTASGLELTADDLVICPGTEIDWEAIPGLREACGTPYASTNYESELAPHTWEVLSALETGEAVFAVSYRATPCPGVGLKPLFLAVDYWRRTGRLEDIRITVVLEDEQPFGLPAVDERVRRELGQLGAVVHDGCLLTAVDPDSRILRARASDGSPLELRFDALHVAPPYRGYDWVSAAGLAEPVLGLVAVDPETLEHPDHPGLWSLGDAAALDTPSSGGGLRPQAARVGDGIIARRTGRERPRYDGYTVAPIPVPGRRLMLAERDRMGRESRTIPPISRAPPRRSVFLFDFRLQPAIYWRWLLKGHVSR